MQTDHYTAIWNQLKPSMEDLLAQMAAHIRHAMRIEPISPPEQGGDEEFKLSQDWRLADQDESVIGVDVVLADADVRGEGGGLNVMLTLQSYGGQHVGTYIPENYTSAVFTMDVDELKSRLNGMRDDATEFAEVICKHLQGFKQSPATAMKP